MHIALVLRQRGILHYHSSCSTVVGVGLPSRNEGVRCCVRRTGKVHNALRDALSQPLQTLTVPRQGRMQANSGPKAKAAAKPYGGKVSRKSSAEHNDDDQNHRTGDRCEEDDLGSDFREALSNILHEAAVIAVHAPSWLPGQVVMAARKAAT